MKNFQTYRRTRIMTTYMHCLILIVASCYCFICFSLKFLKVNEAEHLGDVPVCPKFLMFPYLLREISWPFLRLPHIKCPTRVPHSSLTPSLSVIPEEIHMWLFLGLPPSESMSPSFHPDCSLRSYSCGTTSCTQLCLPSQMMGLEVYWPKERFPTDLGLRAQRVEVVFL